MCDTLIYIYKSFFYTLFQRLCGRNCSGVDCLSNYPSGGQCRGQGQAQTVSGDAYLVRGRSHKYSQHKYKHKHTRWVFLHIIYFGKWKIHAYKAIWPTIFMSDCLIAKMYGLLAILHKWICLFCVEQRLRGFDRSDLMKISWSDTVRIRTADLIKLWLEQMSCKENCLAIFSIVKVVYINI